ncbi:hypothetical protein [Bacillus massiliigorillae]|nr:hypothetical protein [Bacillus massiliigorillae]
MIFSEWIKETKGMNLLSLRRKMISNEEWDQICQQYENYCSLHSIKPNYN